ncbi:MAG TPA: chemotaxis protein CheW [Gemmataceae bacterium]|nr:chemotaxis protein CheW [Gemmataceae bacterium]
MRVEENPVVEGKPVEVLVFELAGRRFGIHASEVREIIRAVTIVPLPKAPPLIEGIINLRGRVILVVDIRQRFGLPAKPLDASDHLIVGWTGEHLVAIRIDRAVELARADGNAIEDAAGVLSEADSAREVAVLPDGIVPIGDLRSLLSSLELSASAGLLSAAPTNDGREGQS